MHLSLGKIQARGKREILGATTKEQAAEVRREQEPNHLHNVHLQAFHRSLVSSLEELDLLEVSSQAKAQQLLVKQLVHQLGCKMTFHLRGMAKNPRNSLSLTRSS